MPLLAEIQHKMRDAVVEGDTSRIASLLREDKDFSCRFTVHCRNYETSLVDALLTKYPATVWLVGSPFVTEAAVRFVHQQPPTAPCIAEYGSEFPQFLSMIPGAERVPYLHDFAALEWHVGQASVAICSPPLTAAYVSSWDGHALLNSVLRLQSGLHYIHSSWPVDELLRVYLADAASDAFEMSPWDLYLEVYGSRGDIRIDRLDAATFVFRAALANSEPIGEAAERALELDNSFAPGRALGALIGGELIRAIEQKG